MLQTYYSPLQSTTPVPLRTTNILLQYYSVRQSTTPALLQYYAVLQSTTLYYKVLLRPKRRQNDVHPVLLRTTKYYSSTTPYYKPPNLLYYSKRPKRAFRARPPQLFTTTCFQNDRFVRGFLNFSSNKLPKRAFRARLPQLFTTTCFQNEHFVRRFLNFSVQLASKTSISCEASSTFHYNLLPKRAFRARLPQLFKQGATQNAKMTCHLESLKRFESARGRPILLDGGRGLKSHGEWV